MNRRELFLALAAAGIAPQALAQAAPGAADPTATARDLWLYGLPLIEMATTRARHLKGGGGINRLQHTRQLADDRFRTVTTPNNDTLYSFAWLDLSQGPVTLTVPPLDRYWSVALMDMYTNNNAVLGTRTVGPQGGTFTIVGPGQAGGGPETIRAATPHAWLLVRLLTDGGDDLPVTHALQDRFKLTGPAGATTPVYAPREAQPADYFASMLKLLEADPPPAVDRRMLARLRTIKLDSSETAAGVQQARMIAQMAKGRQGYVQGWSYTRPNLGDYDQDYLYRAIIALLGLGALPVAEAMYMRAEGDSGGLFKGDDLYRLSLPAQMPLDAFWSLSMYEVVEDGQQFFTANPLNRYSIGDRTKGLKRNADGSIDLWIGRSDPGGERSANWLPAPRSGPYSMTMRTYLPRAELLDGRWRLPAVAKA
ncbi:DUF1254 domain-containing protein [Caulobacter mirabilis]|uniref:Phosphatidylserine decarboxylase n=1 Tax=Caulobacter mirabilis TaxID=69666 RepID=A0A2D2AVI8_9CAUL|nr:DUF1254 domain-containing protein [Caulobacter mirabilis]ATQ42018.1 phosphatidylserine decarboxylase [Caulobacter mirabilis]